MCVKIETLDKTLGINWGNLFIFVKKMTGIFRERKFIKKKGIVERESEFIKKVKRW